MKNLFTEQSGIYTLPESGEISQPIVFENLNPLVINGQGHSIKQLAQFAQNIILRNCANIQIDNITLEGNPAWKNTRNPGVGLQLINCSGQIILNNVCGYNNAFAGIEGINTPGVVIRNCSLSCPDAVLPSNGNWNFGIYTYGGGCDGWTIEKNHIHNIGTGICTSSGTDDLTIIDNRIGPIRCQHGIYLGQPSRLLVERNKFSDVNQVSIKLSLHASTTTNPTDIKISDNLCHNFRDEHPSGIGVCLVIPENVPTDVYWQNVTISGNTICGQSKGMYLEHVSNLNESDNVFRHCVVDRFQVN